MDKHVLGRGVTREGHAWLLTVEGTPENLTTMVQVSSAHGDRPWGSGMGGPALPPGRRLNIAWGNNDSGIGQHVVRVTADVEAVIVTLSDGATEQLVLFGDPARYGARIAALVLPRGVGVQRLVLLDSTGRELPDAYDL